MKRFKIIKLALILSIVFITNPVKGTSLIYQPQKNQISSTLFEASDTLAINHKITGIEHHNPSNLQNTGKVTLGGFVYNYNEKTQSGCLFIDLEMVDAGIVHNINDGLTNGCFSEKYGYGAYIYFGDISPENYYKKPIEGLLMNYYGTWALEDDKYVFHVQEIQPFF
ncbi:MULTISPECIES: hypothetical protein [Aequorivita]|uniref:Uncharacterized protein n=2 Tax=Aequorivita TaxID=153265 RepID=A0AB35YVU5_9FLAO|nr:hypothetical protein [Aequorivita sp. Ant34-E75]WGF91266.1 hypothetical protein QCQ61_08535 [Aequorivita sp. Ant34-E75]